jgi:hypothetical protein
MLDSDKRPIQERSRRLRFALGFKLMSSLNVIYPHFYILPEMKFVGLLDRT